MSTTADRRTGTDTGLRSTTDPVPDRVISLEAHLGVPVQEAFRYFTENERLESWLAAKADVQPRVGGWYQLYWAPESPEDNSTIGCRVTALVPDRLIAFQWRSPEQFKAFANGADPLTHVVVSFFPEETGTRIHLLHSGWRSSPDWGEARVWQERAWSVALERLTQQAGGPFDGGSSR